MNKTYWLEIEGKARKYIHIKDGCVYENGKYIDMTERELERLLAMAKILGFKTGSL